MTDEQSYQAGCEQAKADWEADAISLNEYFQTEEYVRGYTDTIKALSLKPAMDNDDVRSISENDQLKEDAYHRYIEWCNERQADLLVACDALELGPERVAALPPDSIDFICDMAAVALRDFAERQMGEE